MTLLTAKLFLEKAYAWCVQHWRWLVFALVALVAYLAGRKNARMIWAQAELARKQYKREAEAIEKAHADKNKKIKKAEAQFERSKQNADQDKLAAEEDLETQKRKEVLRLVSDQDAIDEALKNSGIDEV